MAREWLFFLCLKIKVMAKLKVAFENIYKLFDNLSVNKTTGEALQTGIGYKPHAGQKHVHDSNARFKTIRSGRRWGKSLVAAMDVMPLICTPGSRGWIVAPSYSLGEKEWRYIWDALFAGPTFPNSALKQYMCKTERKTNNPVQGQMFLKFCWAYDIAFKYPERGLEPKPVEIIVKSFENPSSLLGDELDWIILSEGAWFRQWLWEQFLEQTLTSREGRMILPSTSSAVSDFMDRFFKLGQNPAEPDYYSREAPSFENPYWAPNVEAEKARYLHLVETDQMSLEAYEEQVLGKKVNYTGRYYTDFRANIHIQEVEVDYLKTCYRSWDFGYRHPCIIWAQVNKKDQLLLLHTYLGSDIDDDDLCWMGLFLSGVLLVDLTGKFYRINQFTNLREYMPDSVYKRVVRENITPFFDKQMEFKDFSDAYGGVQEKNKRGSSIKIMGLYGLYPRYKFERKRNDETQPESVQIIKADLKLRQNKEPNMIVNKQNTLMSEMFRNLSYEKKKDGTKPKKYEKDGYYEHPHDCLRYLSMHIRQHVLYKYNQLTTTKYRWAA